MQPAALVPQSPQPYRQARRAAAGFNKTVQRTGASRFAQRQIQRHRRLAPVADLVVGRINMAIRMISFFGGALFGAAGAVVVFRFVEGSPVHWGIVGLAAIVMGLLATL